MKVGDRARIKRWEELDHGDGGWRRGFFEEHGGETGTIIQIQGNAKYDSAWLEVPSCKTHKVQLCTLVPIPLTWRDVPEYARDILEELSS